MSLPIGIAVPTPLSTGGAVETWQPQTFDPSPIGVPVPTPLSTEGAAETGQLAPTPTGSAATVGPAWTFAELSHAKWEITQRRAVAMAWKLGLTERCALQLSRSMDARWGTYWSR